jgi:hypothetical protein
MDGRPLWSRNFEVPGFAVANNDTLEGVAATSDGFVVTGSVSEPGHDTGTPFDTEIALQALDTTGAVLWSRVEHDRGVKDFESGIDVAVNDHGYIYAVGRKDRGWSQRSAEHGWVARYSSDGRFRWMNLWEAETAANGVAIGTHGIVWVAGEERESSSGGTAMRLRAYMAVGVELWSIRRDPDGHWASATSVVADDLGAFVAGAVGYVRDGGRAGGT